MSVEHNPRGPAEGLRLAGLGPRAFLEFYEAHFDFVWRSLRRLGVPLAHVDDAAQEVFVAAFQRLSSFEGRSSPKTWLFGIAFHTMQRFHRRNKHAPQELPEVLADVGPDPHEAAVRAEAVRTLYLVLDSLDPDQRAVFVMAELEEMGAKEIANLMGVPINTVYSRLRAARQEFNAELHRVRARDAWRQT